MKPDYGYESADCRLGETISDQPREIMMLTKRMQEMSGYAGQSVMRVNKTADRIFGAVPETGSNEKSGNDRATAGEWGTLLEAFNNLERRISEFDAAARRLEGL